jgi:hypothetical protein
VVGFKENGVPEVFNIYPNPASDHFTVSGQWSAVSGKENFTIRICNIIGEIVEKSTFFSNESSRNRFDISNFQPGIYFISIYDGSKLFQTKKLIVIK